jgi:hypothetical protein
MSYTVIAAALVLVAVFGLILHHHTISPLQKLVNVNILVRFGRMGYDSFICLIISSAIKSSSIYDFTVVRYGYLEIQNIFKYGAPSP